MALFVGSIALLALVLVAVLLDPSDSQAWHSAAVDRALPAGEFLETEGVALAGFINAQEPTGDSGNNFRLATNDPAGRLRRGNELSVSGSPRGPMTCAGRIFWFSSIVTSHLLNHCYWPTFNLRPLKIFINALVNDWSVSLTIL